MATGTKSPPKKKNLVSIPVKFTGVGIGVDTVRIGIKVSRERMDLTNADHYFCNRRLQVALILGHETDDPKQTTFEDVDHKVVGSADVKGFRVTTEVFSAGLTFGKNDMDVEELSGFASAGGRLVINDVGAIPDPVPSEETANTGDDDEDEEEDEDEE